MDRRNFLNRLAGIVGGVAVSATLSSCGGAGGGATTGGGGDIPTEAAQAADRPSAWRFVRALKTGAALPDGRTADTFVGGATVSDTGTVMFFVRDTQKRTGLYRLGLDDTSRIHTVLREGDTLADGTRIARIEGASVNVHGVVALRVTAADGFAYIVAGAPLARIVGYGTPTPDGTGTFGSHFGDLEMLDDGSLLFVGRYTVGRSARAKEGLFRLTRLQPAAGETLYTSGALLPDSADLLGRFGLIDGDAATGQWTAQVFSRLTGAQAVPGLDSAATTGVVTGRVGTTQAKLAFRATPSPFKDTPRRDRAVVGPTLHGPRLGGDGRLVQVVGPMHAEHKLYEDGVLLARSGDVTPRGAVIKRFFGVTPAVAGTTFASVDCENDTQELLAFRGGTMQALLASGDDVEGAPLHRFGFGMLRGAVSAQLVMAFAGRDLDGSSSLVLGLPA